MKRIRSLINHSRLSSSYKILIYITLIFLPLNTINCAMDIPEKSYDYLAPPLITSCTWYNENIIINFIGYNNEYYFDGYNAYVSDNRMYITSITSYKAVQVEGLPSAVPSYPLSPDDFNPGKERTLTLYQFAREIEDNNYVLFPFETDSTYYIFLCAHHRDGDSYLHEEGVSNQKVFSFGDVTCDDLRE